MTGRNEDDAAARARQRASWPVRVGTLHAPPRDDLSATTTVAERIGMMWPLAVDAWAFSGQTIPDYRRADTPMSVTFPDDPDRHDRAGRC